MAICFLFKNHSVFEKFVVLLTFCTRTSREKMDGIRKNCLNCTLILLHLIGFVIHSYLISKRYFRYETRTQLLLNIPTNCESPALSVCWRYADIVDIDKIDDRSKYLLPVKNYSNYDGMMTYVNAVHSELSLAEIFGGTPAIEDIFRQCIIRNNRNYSLAHLDGAECLDHIKVRKFYYQQYMCYRSMLNIEGTFSYDTSASMYTYPAMAFELGFKLNLFNMTEIIIPVVHDGFGFPSTSIRYTPQFIRYTIDNDDIINYFHFSYYSIQITRMEAPYDTMCRRSESGIKSECLRTCIANRSIERIGKHSIESIVLDDDTVDFNLKHLNTQDFRNESTNVKIMKLGNECRAICNFLDCDTSYTLLNTISLGHDSRAILFRIDLPKTPNYQIVYLANLSLVDFSLYICSCLGMWLGISLFTLNPLRLLVYFKNGMFRTQTSSNDTSNDILTENYYSNCMSNKNRCVVKMELLSSGLRMLHLELALQKEQLKGLSHSIHRTIKQRH